MSILSQIADFFDLPILGTSLKVYFYVDTKAYEVEQFSIDFSKPLDRKGEPQGETRGGQFVVELRQAVPEHIYDWILGKGILKQGLLTFENELTNSPLRLEFFNAACVNFVRKTNAFGGLSTVLYISPEQVRINGVDHDNTWAK